MSSYTVVPETCPKLSKIVDTARQKIQSLDSNAFDYMTDVEEALAELESSIKFEITTPFRRALTMYYEISTL